MEFLLKESAATDRLLEEVQAWPDVKAEASRVEDDDSLSIRRTSLRLSMDDGTLIRFTVEKVMAITSDHSRQTCGFTLELLNGDMKALIEFSLLLSAKYPCHLVARSTAERRRDHALRTLSETPKWTAPAIDRNGTAVGEFRRRLKHLLRDAILQQELFLEAPDDIETLHRLRVSIRRFRALLSFLSPALPTEDQDRRQDALRQFSRSFAPIRDLDVLIDTWDALQAISPKRDEKEPSLDDLFHSERDRLSKDVSQRLSDGAATPVFLGIWGWLHGDEPIEDDMWTDLSLWYELPHRLKKWDKAIRRDFESLSAYDSAAVHALRIRCKKTRYVLEEFASVLPRKRRKRAARLKELQDLLGAVFDTYRGIEVLDALTASRRSARIQYERGMLTGFLQYRRAELYQELSIRKDEF
jgi:CHAD domain-containing protein